MKKNILLFVLMILVLSIIIPCFTAEATINNSIDEDTNSRELKSYESNLIKSSKETIEIAPMITVLY